MDEAYVLFIGAIAAFEHVVNLSPDFAHIQSELDEALHDFASAALSVGNIFWHVCCALATGPRFQDSCQR